MNLPDIIWLLIGLGTGAIAAGWWVRRTMAEERFHERVKHIAELGCVIMKLEVEKKKAKHAAAIAARLAGSTFCAGHAGEELLRAEKLN